MVTTCLIFLISSGVAAIDRLGYGFGTYGHIFFHLFAIQELSAGLIGFSILVLGYWISRRGFSARGVERLVRWTNGRPLPTSLLVAFALSAGTLFVYHTFPLSMDEYAPVFQSEIFATGKLFGEYPTTLVSRLVHPDFLGHFFLFRPSTGAIASAYWPGHALLLTPFTLAGAPWLLNPLLGVIGVVLLRYLARELIGQEAMGWVVVLALASPVFWAYAISFYPMTAHLVVNLAFACLIVKPGRWRCLLAGLVGSWGLILHQPIPHLLFAVPWLAFLVARRRFRGLGYVLLGYLPVTACIGGGWFLLRAMISSEWNEFLISHDLPRGPLPRFHSESENPLLRFGVATLNIFHDRWGVGWSVELRSQLKLWLWCVPGLPILAAIGAWISRRRSRVVLLPACSFLLTLLFFLLVPMGQGHGWGNRYLHPVWWVLPFYGGACLANERFRELKHTWSTVVLATIIVFLPLRLGQIESFVTQMRDQRPFPHLEGPAVVFLDVKEGFYREDLVRNDPFLRDDHLMLTAGDSEGDRELANMLLEPPIRRIQRGRDVAWLGPRIVFPFQH